MTVIKNTKYLGINLAKYVQDLYLKIWKTKTNGKMLQKQSKQDLNKQRNSPCSWITIFNTVNANSHQNELQI